MSSREELDLTLAFLVLPNASVEFSNSAPMSSSDIILVYEVGDVSFVQIEIL